MRGNTVCYLCLLIAIACLLSICSRGAIADPRHSPPPLPETKYLAFQIFTFYSPNSQEAQLLSNGLPVQLTPGSPALLAYINDIKNRIGTVGAGRTRLAVILGPLCFDQTDAEVAKFISGAFDLALKTDVAVGFHIDDSIFWSSRKDLLSDPNNLEALDWDGTPNTGRRLDWSKTPTRAAPQMCFNSKAVLKLVKLRSAVIGKATAAGVARLKRSNRPELFAGVIAGWETMIGQDFNTGKYLGYRALMNRGYSHEHLPMDPDAERASVVKEFIDLWSSGIAGAGVSPGKIYSHTAFLSHRAFDMGADKTVTYMKRDRDIAYLQHNHFAPPSVAFGANHRPGYSTYPQPGLVDDIYAEMSQHRQAAWASCEGTNMQPESEPGQTGMTMETYLAKMFNHGAEMVNIFAWGIGGDAMKTMNFRLVTEGDDALRAYRKFLKGEPLIEAKTETSTLMTRLPAKIHRIQSDLPAWVQKSGSQAKADKATALMEKLDGNLKANDFAEAEKTADSILEMIDGAPLATPPAQKPPPKYLLFWRSPEQAAELIKTIGEQGDGRTRLLGFGVPCATFVQEKQVAANIHKAFFVASQNNLALMLHFDFHIAWANRPELWNWFDPKQPGYNPDNRRNVEWFGWDGPPAKARYLNHGEAQRMPPPVCFTSKAIRAEWTRLIRYVIAPPLKKELAQLNREGKGYLFAGILVGSEPEFDNYTQTDPDITKLIASDGSPTGQLGYRALLDRGYSMDHPPTDIHRALADVIQETVAFWCKNFVEAGFQAQELYPHIPAGAPAEMTSAPVSTAFNTWSNPGWSTYPVGPIQHNFQLLYDVLAKHGSPPWGGVEANVGMPGSLVDWETYLAWHYNHGATLVAINLGATGTDLPAKLERSAFSPEAIAAYRKFLKDEPLIEKPIESDEAQKRIKMKMDTLQAGFRRMQTAGLDPAPIAHFVEERLPALMQANKLAAAEAVIDEAIKRLR